MSQFTLGDYNLRSKVRLHPLVLYQIVKAHERRPLDATHVIGTLLGRYDEDGHIEITNSLTVIHNESDNNVNLDMQYSIDMMELNQLTYAQEKILGWYSTDRAVTSAAVALHDFYLSKCPEPLHLLVDASLRGKRMGIQLYSVVEMGVPDGTKGLMFSLLPVELHCSNVEWASVDSMQKHALTEQANKPLRLLPELIYVVQSIHRMEEHLDLLLKYINEVLERKRRPDNMVGRTLHSALTSVPMIDSESFRLIFNSNVRDMLMSICLSMLVRSQLQISEKLFALPDN